MKVAITGGSGFLGQELTKLLKNEGHEVYILSRSNQNDSHTIQWLSGNNKPEEYLMGQMHGSTWLVFLLMKDDGTNNRNKIFNDYTHEELMK